MGEEIFTETKIHNLIDHELKKRGRAFRSQSFI